MKAAFRIQYGDPDVLHIRDIPKPHPKAGEVLVRIYATTVNRTDHHILTGKPFVMRLVGGLFRPNVSVTGTDFAGVVEATGPHVTEYRVGDRLMGFDDNGLQSHAMYAAVSTKNCQLIPTNIDLEQAAASAEGVHYAYNFINKVQLHAGQKALVNGATGAIGSALTQMLLFEGVQVDAVCGTAQVAQVKHWGVQQVFDYQKEDFTQSNRTYDYVFDAVGKSAFARCKPLLKKKGIYISSELGTAGANLWYSLWTPLLGNKKVVFPYPQNIKQSLQYIHNLIEQKAFVPLIDKTYMLENIQEAYQYVASGQKIGNVILKIG